MLKRLNLKFFREKQGLKQEDVAEKLGIAKATYANIERGVADPSFGVLERFAENFKCEDIWELFKKFQ